MNLNHETDAFFEQAGLPYISTRQVRWESHAAYYNRGNALVARAKQAEGAEADALFEQAGEQYAAALRVRPDKHEALDNWAITLMLRYHNSRDEQVKLNLLERAKSVYLRIEKLVPGRAAYDLACLHALCRRQKECRIWLNRAGLAGTLPDLAHLKEDRDLDQVRSSSWFKGFLDKLEGPPRTLQLKAN